MCYNKLVKFLLLKKAEVRNYEKHCKYVIIQIFEARLLFLI